MVDRASNENHFPSGGSLSSKTPAESPPEIGVNSSDLIDPELLWTAIRRKRGFIFAVAACLGCLVFIHTFTSGMRFWAAGQLYLGEIDRSTRVSQDAPAGLDLSGGSQQQVASEIEILKSRSLVRQAVQETGLNVSIAEAGQRQPNYWQWRKSGRNLDLIDGALGYVRATATALSPSIREPQQYRARFLNSSEYELYSPMASLGRGKLGQPFQADGLDLTLTRGDLGEPKPESEYDLVVLPLDRVVDSTMRLLKVTAPKESSGGSSINVVTLEFSNASPRLSAEFLKKLMLGYLNERQSWKTEDASAAQTFIKNELKNVRESLDQFQTKLADYRKRHGDVVLDNQAKAMIEQVGKYEEQRAAARLQVAALADIKDGLKSQNSPMGAYLVGEADDKVLASMAESLSQAREKLADLETRFQEAAPEVRDQRSRVNAQLDSIRNYVSSRQKRAQANLGALNGIIGQFEHKLLTVPAAELGLAQLLRESEVYSKTYSYLLERQQQAGILRASTLSKNRILDAPEVPLWEDSPNLHLRLTSLLIGLILGAAFVVVRSLFADKFQSPGEVCKSLGSVPLLGTIPQIPKNKKDSKRNLIAEYPNSRFAEAFRTLRIKLYAWKGDDRGKVFVITSPSSADGKTTCVRALAAALCTDGKSVLIIDADLRRSAVKDSAVESPASGLTDVLTGDCNWHDVAQQSPQAYSTLYHLTSGSVGRPELLTTDNMRRLLIETRTTFDFILIDCPAFPMASEALALTPMVDGVISIVRLFNSPKRLASEHIVQVSSYARQYGLIINGAEIESGLAGTSESFETPTQTTAVQSTPDAAGNTIRLGRAAV